MRDLNFEDTIIYRQALPAQGYHQAEEQAPEDGPYTGLVVDFTDRGTVGVREDGFNGLAPLYYVEERDIVDVKRTGWRFL